MPDKEAPLQFRAQLTQRQASLMLSGQGDRCLIELETFGMDAIIALVGMAKFTATTFLVTIQPLPPLPDKAGTKQDKTQNEIDTGAEGKAHRVGRGGAGKRRDQ